MGIIEDDPEPVGSEVGEIVGGEFLQGGDQVIRGFLYPGGVGVGLKLMLARTGVEKESQEAADRTEKNAEENKTGMC